MALIENPGPKTELQCVRKLLALNIQLMDELLNEIAYNSLLYASFRYFPPVYQSYSVMVS